MKNVRRNVDGEQWIHSIKCKAAAATQIYISRRNLVEIRTSSENGETSNEKLQSNI